MSCRIGIKSGCFTLLTPGHVWSLKRCKKFCDYLIVLTNTDDYIKEKKGCVPLTIGQRATLINALPEVDEVHWFEGPSEEPWIKKFHDEIFHHKFGSKAKLIVFHSTELYLNQNPPGFGIADEIRYIDRNGIDCSVSEIFSKIQAVNFNADFIKSPITGEDTNRRSSVCMGPNGPNIKREVYHISQGKVKKVIYKCGCKAEGVHLSPLCPEHGKPITRRY